MTLEADDDGTGLKTSLRFFERIFLPQAYLLTHSLTYSLGQIKPWLKPRAIKSLKIAHSWTPDKRGTSYKCSYLKFVLRMPFKV